MNKRTVILLWILTLLVVVILFRWDIKVYENSFVQFNDRLTMTYLLYSNNNFLVSSAYPIIVTILLYGAIIITVIALLSETKY